MTEKIREKDFLTVLREKESVMGKKMRKGQRRPIDTEQGQTDRDIDRDTETHRF